MEYNTSITGNDITVTMKSDTDEFELSGKAEEGKITFDKLIANGEEQKLKKPLILDYKKDKAVEAVMEVSSTDTLEKFTAPYGKNGAEKSEGIMGWLGSNKGMFGVIGAVAAGAIGMMSGGGVIGALLLAAAGYFGGGFAASYFEEEPKANNVEPQAAPVPSTQERNKQDPEKGMQEEIEISTGAAPEAEVETEAEVEAEKSTKPMENTRAQKEETAPEIIDTKPVLPRRESNLAPSTANPVNTTVEYAHHDVEHDNYSNYTMNWELNKDTTIKATGQYNAGTGSFSGPGTFKVSQVKIVREENGMRKTQSVNVPDDFNISLPADGVISPKYSESYAQIDQLAESQTIYPNTFIKGVKEKFGKVDQVDFTLDVGVEDKQRIKLRGYYYGVIDSRISSNSTHSGSHTSIGWIQVGDQTMTIKELTGKDRLVLPKCSDEFSAIKQNTEIREAMSKAYLMAASAKEEKNKNVAKSDPETLKKLTKQFMENKKEPENPMETDIVNVSRPSLPLDASRIENETGLS